LEGSEELPQFADRVDARGHRRPVRRRVPPPAATTSADTAAPHGSVVAEASPRQSAVGVANGRRTEGWALMCPRMFRKARKSARRGGAVGLEAEEIAAAGMRACSKLMPMRSPTPNPTCSLA